MPCSKSVTISGVSDIYWGQANSVDFDPTTFMAWDDSQVSSLLALLHSSNLPYDPAGYFYDNAGHVTTMLAWFVVIDSATTPATTTGFQYGLNNAVTPTTDVFDQDATSVVPEWDFIFGFFRPYTPPTVWNAWSPDNVANGWHYYLRTVNGIAYRFYVFGEMNNQFNEYNATVTWVEADRVTGTAILTGTLPFGPFFSTQFSGSVTSPDATSYSESFVDIIWFEGSGTFSASYANAGPDDGPTVISTASVKYFVLFADALNGAIGSYEFTLFVST